MKACAKISSVEIIKLQKKILELQLKMKDIRDSCTHEYEVLSTHDGWDGYSRGSFDIVEEVHCVICGDYTYRNTDRVNKH